MSSVFLRAFELDDYRIINQWRNDKEVQSKTCGHFRYVSSEMEKNWVQQKMLNNSQDVYLAICLNDETRRMIGYTSINHINHMDRKAHSGAMVIQEETQRSGEYILDTSIIKMRHVFDDLNIHRYTGSCLETQISSRLMMEMMGFSLEGIERDSVYKQGRFHNVLRYSILSTEYYDLLNNGGYTAEAIGKRLLQARKKLKKHP